jgi:hypothetical protein
MKKNERHTITIQLKPYIQDFFFNERCKNFVSTREMVGLIIKPFLERRPKNKLPDIIKDPEYITFPLPLYNNFDLRCNYWISPKNQKTIQLILDRHFKEIFYNYMDDKVRFTYSFKKSILQFCSDYNIPFNSDYYETLKKDYYRQRKKAEKDRKIISRTVPKLRLRSICVFLI